MRTDVIGGRQTAPGMKTGTSHWWFLAHSLTSTFKTNLPLISMSETPIYEIYFSQRQWHSRARLCIKEKQHFVPLSNILTFCQHSDVLFCINQLATSWSRFFPWHSTENKTPAVKFLLKNKTNNYNNNNTLDWKQHIMPKVSIILNSLGTSRTQCSWWKGPQRPCWSLLFKMFKIQMHSIVPLILAWEWKPASPPAMKRATKQPCYWKCALCAQRVATAGIFWYIYF